VRAVMTKLRRAAIDKGGEVHDEDCGSVRGFRGGDELRREKKGGELARQGIEGHPSVGTGI